MNKLLMVLLVPALLGLPGCLGCMHHSETTRSLDTDGQFEPSAVSGLPAGATSFFINGSLLALDSNGHVTSNQSGNGDMLVTTTPDTGADDLYVRFDLSALAADVTSLGVDMRDYDSARPLIGHEYTVTSELDSTSTTASATGSVTVVDGVTIDEAFALDIDFTIPTSTSAPAKVSGIVGWKAQSYEGDVESGDCS